jgi:hypothetical protein
MTRRLLVRLLTATVLAAVATVAPQHPGVRGRAALGESWGAWVQDTVTEADSYVGRIRVPASRSGRVAAS